MINTEKNISHLSRERKLRLHRRGAINTHKCIPAIRARRIRKRHISIDVIHGYKLWTPRHSSAHVLEG